MPKPDILKISFEFSSKLGIRDLPKLDSRHESNIPGLLVVGDLADAPIIKVALNQGYEVTKGALAELPSLSGQEGVLDVLIVGAGPAGIGAGLACQESSASFVILEKERPFASIQNFPKAKFVFSEPRELQNRGNFWFEDAQKEELIEKWDRALDEKSLPIRQPEEVVDIAKEDGVFRVTARNPNDEDGSNIEYRARRVVLAIGRRGSYRKLEAKGEELDKVSYALKDPDEFRGQKVLVAGGGDSAVEAAMACAEAGADVTISYRGDSFNRAKKGNRDKIDAMIKAGRIRAEFATMPEEVLEDKVILKRGQDRLEIENDQVLVFFGTKLPSKFLKRIGLRMAGEMDWLRVAWITSFALITYLIYVIKSKKDFFPFGEGDLLHGLPSLLQVDLGFREVDGGFWGTVLYGLLIVYFGVKAYRKYPSPTQKRRYVSLILFQWVILFGVPELIAPLIIDRPWMLYAFGVPWPLRTWSLIDAPGWGAGDTLTACLWIGLGFVTAFVLIPLYVRKHGQKFCSYLCGCGGLAETLGDQWRHLAPRGKHSYQSEWFGRAIFFLAIPVTLLILNDAWSFYKADALYETKAFAQHWYGLVVDFWLASVLGVAFYPYLGNRVWCRFFCPLRAFMEILSRWFSKIAIVSNDKCIGCSECTRYCQMGIDVQKFAQKQETFHNGNSSCIQCGICVQVCPMDVLSLGEREIDKPAQALGPAGHKLRG